MTYIHKIDNNRSPIRHYQNIIGMKITMQKTIIILKFQCNIIMRIAFKEKFTYCFISIFKNFRSIAFTH